MRCTATASLLALLIVASSAALGQSNAVNSHLIKPGAGKVPSSYSEFAPSAWFKEKAPLTPALAKATSMQQSDSIQLRMLPDCLVRYTHGVQYIKIYMLNPGATPLLIRRADDTILGVSLLFQVEGNWRAFKTFPREYCGNSFWQDTLPAHSYMTMEVDVYTFFRGFIPTPCKVVAKTGTQVLESPIFTTRLTAIQDQALRQL